MMQARSVHDTSLHAISGGSDGPCRMLTGQTGRTPTPRAHHEPTNRPVAARGLDRGWSDTQRAAHPWARQLCHSDRAEARCGRGVSGWLWLASAPRRCTPRRGCRRVPPPPRSSSSWVSHVRAIRTRASPGWRRSAYSSPCCPSGSSQMAAPRDAPPAGPEATDRRVVGAIGNAVRLRSRGALRWGGGGATR
jgi:hypothetical protein